MRFLTNIDDPNKPDAVRHIFVDKHETFADALQAHLAWLSDKIIGDPQATDTYTVEQLKEMGMVGVYARD